MIEIMINLSLFLSLNNFLALPRNEYQTLFKI